jgi:hypothetical protein
MVTGMTDELNRKPRRRIVLLAKIEADDWERLQHELTHLATEIARHGKLSSSSVSGGYSCGHIVVTSEDGSIDHDSWAKELDAYLEALAAVEKAKAAGIVTPDEARRDA